MKILVLGGDGMLGHRLVAQWSAHHEVKVTLRSELATYSRFGLFNPRNTVGGVDAVRAPERLAQVVAAFKPEAIVNAVGLVKQRPNTNDSIASIEVNALLPHRLAQLAREASARFVHISTDCVFSGRRGNYSESDVPDAQDVYGRTKLVGEVSEEHCVTLRTSLIGHELQRHTGLVEWFLAQRGPVQGYRAAIFSGFTTIELARIIESLLVRHRAAHGVWHVSSEPIDKYSLLALVKKHYGLSTEIVPQDEFRCDRSLDSTRFRRQFDYEPPSWDAMVQEMYEVQGLKR